MGPAAILLAQRSTPLKTLATLIQTVAFRLHVVDGLALALIVRCPIHLRLGLLRKACSLTPGTPSFRGRTRCIRLNAWEKSLCERVDYGQRSRRHLRSHDDPHDRVEFGAQEYILTTWCSMDYPQSGPIVSY